MLNYCIEQDVETNRMRNAKGKLTHLIFEFEQQNRKKHVFQD